MMKHPIETLRWVPNVRKDLGCTWGWGTSSSCSSLGGAGDGRWGQDVSQRAKCMDTLPAQV